MMGGGGGGGGGGGALLIVLAAMHPRVWGPTIQIMEEQSGWDA